MLCLVLNALGAAILHSLGQKKHLDPDCFINSSQYTLHRAQAIRAHFPYSLFYEILGMGKEKKQRQTVFGQTIYNLENKISFQFELETGKAEGQITH